MCALRQAARVGGPRTPLPATPVASPCGWLLCCPAASNSQEWGPQYLKRPVGPPFPWSLAPHVAPRARLPLFRPRPPLPCPWAAALLRSGGAWLLPWLLAPAGKCGCPALPSTLRPPLHGPLGAVGAPLEDLSLEKTRPDT